MTKSANGLGRRMMLLGTTAAAMSLSASVKSGRRWPVVVGCPPKPTILSLG